MLSAIRKSVMYQRGRVFADLHFYQKWRAVWPHLQGMPRERLRLLDAGCGNGQWCAEIACRRPGWSIVGIDKDGGGIERAKSRTRDMSLSSLTFKESDFADFEPDRPFDVVLSICSAHYGTTPLETELLFKRMRSWLTPTGYLVLLVPRMIAETPFVEVLRHPRWHEVFSRDGLKRLCERSGLTIQCLAPSIGRIGTVAKQVDWARIDVPEPAGGAISVIARGVAAVDSLIPQTPDRSLMWLLVAQRQAES